MKHQNINVIENGIKITLNLGRQGEYNVRDIKFDMSDFQQKYGDGTATIVHYPANGSAYTVPSISGDTKDSAVLDSNNILTWTIGRLATMHDGYGVAEITWLTADGLKKSIRYNTYCKESIGNYGADRTAQQSYIDQMIELASTITDLSSEFSDAERIAAEISDARENAVSDIEALKNGAVSAVNTAKSESIEDIGDSKESALDALNTAKQTALTDIESAKQNAETDINAEILIAETHANNASQSATNASNSATNASNYAISASQSANSASSSANTASQSAISAQTSANDAEEAERSAQGYAQSAEQSVEDAQDILESVQSEGDTQINRVQAKGQEVLDSIPEDFTEVQKEISEINGSLENLNDTVNGQHVINYIDGKNLDASGVLVNEAGYCVSEFIPITWTGNAAYYCNDTTVQYKYVIAFYDANKTYIKQFKNPATVNAAEYRQINHETQVTQGTAAFVRFSFKSGTIGKITNNARTENYWVAENAYSSGIVADIGDLSELITEEKDSLVGAINEVFESLGDLDTTVNGSLGELDSTINGETSRNYVEGKNLYVYGTIHKIIDDSDASISDYIPITLAAGDKVAFRYTDDKNDAKQYYLWFFDSNKEFISYRVRNPVPAMVRVNLEIPSGATYIRISFKKGFEGALTDYGGTSLYYKAAKTIVSNGIIQNIGSIDELDTVNKDNIVAAINEVKSSASSFPVKPKDTTFFVSSVNLVNPDTYVSGQFVNQTNGNFVNNAPHKRTDYIAVEPNKSYFVVASDNIARDTRYAFYKSDKTFISGGLIAGSQGLKTITSPANAAYIVVSMAISLDFMIAQTDTVIPFEPYYTYINKQYINLGSDIVINLPAKIYAMVGYELNIYFENIVENWIKYDWNVDCTVGKQMERGYTITPVESDVGTKTLTIKATDEHGNTKTITSSLIIASASVGNGSSKSVIIFGDSTTNNGIVIEKLNANFAGDVMNVSTLGTRGAAPNLHEGRSGWRLETYFTTESVDYTDGRGHVENPFYNPTSQTFDASYYFANSGVSVPDYFVVNMGINDVFSPANDTALATAIDQFVDYTDAIITSLRTVSQTVKICICCTIPPNHSQDAFGKAYKCGQTRNRYKRNNLLLVERLIDEYDGRESEGIYLIPIHTNLDTVYNMGMETLSVNARNTDVTYQSPISNGGVHPYTSGYWQIADVYTAFLKANA